jgi:hypothetical protein
MELRSSLCGKASYTMEKETFTDRSDKFRWHSKLELYNDFTKRFGLSEHHIDKEIEEVKAIFRLRNNQPIKTVELWQKVGLTLEKKFGG